MPAHGAWLARLLQTYLPTYLPQAGREPADLPTYF